MFARVLLLASALVGCGRTGLAIGEPPSDAAPLPGPNDASSCVLVREPEPAVTTAPAGSERIVWQQAETDERVRGRLFSAMADDENAVVGSSGSLPLRTFDLVRRVFETPFVGSTVWGAPYALAGDEGSVFTLFAVIPAAASTLSRTRLATLETKLIGTLGDGCRDRMALALLRRGVVIVSGGGGNETCAARLSNRAELYDDNTGMLTVLPPMITGRVQHRLLVHGNDVTAIAGQPEGNVPERYDAIANTWTALPTPPIAAIADAVILPNGDIVARGRAVTSTPFAYYDATCRAWTRLTWTPFPLFESGMVERGNEVLVMGGSASGTRATATAATAVYDSSVHRWSFFAPIPQMGNMTAVARNGVVAAFGIPGCVGVCATNQLLGAYTMR